MCRVNDYHTFHTIYFVNFPESWCIERFNRDKYPTLFIILKAIIMLFRYWFSKNDMIYYKIVLLIWEFNSTGEQFVLIGKNSPQMKLFQNI